jgi:hypothetical protein
VYNHLRAPRPFSESDIPRPIWLFDVLRKAGIDIMISGTTVHLRMFKEQRSLSVDLSTYVEQSKWRRAADVPSDSLSVAELAKREDEMAA